MTSQIEIEKAVAQPGAVFKTPEAVLVDSRLSDAEKRRVLESWERDARELSVAEEENMGGGEPDMLARVLEALATLPARDDERPRGPSTKHGSQPTPSSAATPQTSDAPTLTGGEARQGEIILKSPTRKAVFVGGLVLAAVATLLFYLV